VGRSGRTTKRDYRCCPLRAKGRNRRRDERTSEAAFARCADRRKGAGQNAADTASEPTGATSLVQRCIACGNRARDYSGSSVAAYDDHDDCSSVGNGEQLALERNAGTFGGAECSNAAACGYEFRAATVAVAVWRSIGCVAAEFPGVYSAAGVFSIAISFFTVAISASRRISCSASKRSCSVAATPRRIAVRPRISTWIGVCV
jgi:hypothetical protein